MKKIGILFKNINKINMLQKRGSGKQHDFQGDMACGKGTGKEYAAGLF